MDQKIIFLISFLVNFFIIIFICFFPHFRNSNFNFKFEISNIKKSLLLSGFAISTYFVLIDYLSYSELQSVVIIFTILSVWFVSSIQSSQVRYVAISLAHVSLTFLDFSFSTMAGFKWLLITGVLVVLPFLAFLYFRNKIRIRKMEENAKQYQKKLKELQDQASQRIKDTWSQQGVLLGREALVSKYEINKHLQSYSEGKFPYPHYLRVIDGDLVIKGDLLMELNDIPGTNGLLVTGNLKVEGSIINESTDDGSLLLCMGTLSCHAIVAGGSEFVIKKEAKINEIVIGHYNDGILEFGADVDCPLIVNLDHYISIKGKHKGKYIEPWSQSDLWSDYLVSDILVPKESSDYDDEQDDFGSESGFDWRKEILPRLVQKLPVVKKEL